jgi:hypothetical protein
MKRRESHNQDLGIPGCAQIWKVCETTARKVVDSGEVPSRRDHAQRRVVKHSDAAAYRDKRERQRA